MSIQSAFNLGFIIGCVAGGLLLLLTRMTYFDGKEYIRLEAIKNGAAHWDVAPDGKPVFKWNNVPKEKL